MTDLKSFFQSQVEKKEVSLQIDWTKRKERWLFELEELFRMITEALLEAGWQDGQLSAEKYRLSEETLGLYDAPGLTVVLPAGGKVTFKPVASVIVGGYGRVDVTGPSRKRVKLIVDDAIEDRSESDEIPSYERPWRWVVYPGVGTRRSFPLAHQSLGDIFAVVTGSD